MEKRRDEMTLTDADIKDLTITDKEISEWKSQKSDTEHLEIKGRHNI